MHGIELTDPGDEFFRCWRAAGTHLSSQVDGSTTSWIKGDPSPPFLEHLSFRLGNQLFFVRLEDETGSIDMPGSRDGLAYIAEGCRGRACIMPMRVIAGEWAAVRPGWGLIDQISGQDLDPPSLVTTETIEMTDWEVHDFAVQIARKELAKSQLDVFGFNTDPDVAPSIWFERNGRHEWMVVASTRFPVVRDFVPAEWSALARQCEPLGHRGYFASICVASASEPGEPLWRGRPLSARFTQLQMIPPA